MAFLFLIFFLLLDPDFNSLLLDKIEKLEIGRTKKSSVTFTSASQTKINTLLSSKGISAVVVDAEEVEEFGVLVPTADILPFEWSNGVLNWTEDQATPHVMKYLENMLIGKGVSIHDARRKIALQYSMRLPDGGIETFKGFPDIVLADAGKASDIFPYSILCNALLDVELKTPKAYFERFFNPQAILEALSFADILNRSIFVFATDFVTGMTLFCVEDDLLKLYHYKNDTNIPIDIAVTIMHKVIENQRVKLR